MGEVTQQVDDLGRAADDSDWLDHAVRVGLVTYGVVHLTIAWLALQLAFGDSTGSASSTGALQRVSRQPMGELTIWLIALGMLLLVVWRLIEAASGHREHDGGDRLKKRLGSLGKAVLYGSIAVSAFKVAIGAGSSSSSDSTTARLMDLPGGQFLVGLVGLAIIGYGLFQIRRGLSEKFKEHLTSEGRNGDAGRAYVLLGKAGYCAKGTAVLIVGGLFGYAAITHDARKSGGLDQALHHVLQQPFGPYLLGLIAVGIGCYGVFCFARARYLSR